jgi:CelD/BcsL family acetyltransferase involved in cellulose biosynthesis
MLDLRYMDGDGEFFRRLSRQGSGRFEEDCDRCLRIPLPDAWDSYLALLSKKRRHEVRRSLRRATDYGVEFELVCDHDDLSEAMEDMWALHEKRMSAKMGVPTSHPSEYMTFLERMSEQLLAEGRLRLVFMRIGDRRIAVLHQFRHGDVMYAERAGFFDPSGSIDSMRPLFAHAIRSAIEEGCTDFDMMRGYDQYKLGWGATKVQRLAWARVYRGSVAGITRRGRDSLVDWVQRKRSDEPVEDLQSLGQE